VFHNFSDLSFESSTDHIIKELKDISIRSNIAEMKNSDYIEGKDRFDSKDVKNPI
jgi:hypothetical protein